MERSAVDGFVARWVRDRNAHDLEGLLTHLAGDVAFTSPVAARQNGGLVDKVLVFDGPLVVQGHGTYPEG